MTGAGVDQATGGFPVENVIQASLVAGDAGVDLIGSLFGCLFNEVRVSQEGPRHGNHIGVAIGKNLFRQFGRVDPVGSNERDAYLAHHALGHPAKAAARHHRGDGRYAGLMPANAGIDDGGAGLLDAPGQHFYFFPTAAVVHQVEHRQAVDDDKLLPHRFADASNNLNGKANPVLIRPAPFIGALIGLGNDKLIDQVPFRTHHLYPIVTRLLGQLGSADEGANGALHPAARQPPGLERRDGRFDRRGRHRQRMITITAGMQNLHTNLAVFLMYRFGDQAVLVHFSSGRKFGGKRRHPTRPVGRYPAGDYKPDAAAGAFGKVGRHAFKAVLFLFQACMHGAHQNAVFQSRKAQAERGEQMWV